MSGPDSSTGKLKLLIVTDTYIGGRAGSEKYLYTLVSMLDPGKFDIKVVQLMAHKTLPYTDGPLQGHPNVRIESIPVGRVYGPGGLQAFLKIRGDVARHGYDVVQSVHEKADLMNIFLPVSDAGPRKVSSRRDMGFKKGKLLKALFRLFNARFDAVVAPSQAILDHLEMHEKVPAASLRLIRNGIERSRLKPLTAGEKESLRQSLDLDPGNRVIGCVANLKEVKGHGYLLEAFVCLLKQFPGTVLVLAGDGEMRAALEAFIHKAGITDNVRMLGVRNDVPDLLQIFDVVVSSSLSEGLSNALIEAAASGVPVVATGVGGNPEIVRHRENGLIVPAKDSAALCAALCDLLGDAEMSEKLGHNGISLVDREFSLVSIRQMYERLYLDLVPGKRVSVLEEC